MKKLLYVDSCINRENSRTEALAREFLEKKRSDLTIQHVILEQCNLQILDAGRLAWRESAIQARDYTDDYFAYARQFADADELVVAAPYWDLSFPASLKLYFEHICINGLTFTYTETGIPMGLTRIKKATYITTAGGYCGDCDLGYEYVQKLLNRLFSIDCVDRISKEGLDIKP